MKAALPLAAKALILDFEGMDQPGKWAEGASGVTIGRGYDLGYVTPEEFKADWGPLLPENDFRRMAVHVGKKGQDAKKACDGLSGIRIKEAHADKVFIERTMPKEQERTAIAFRGIDHLPEHAQGALVSLVYNRGAKMDGDRRAEMRAIAATILTLRNGDMEQEQAVRRIAELIRDMKRLWPVGTPAAKGLRRRRDAEAKLVETGRFP